MSFKLTVSSGPQVLCHQKTAASFFFPTHFEGFVWNDLMLHPEDVTWLGRPQVPGL